MEDVVTDTAAPESPLAKWRNEVSRKFQHYLERSSPHTARRWLVTLAAAAIYILRVYYARGFYVISYALSIYILNLLIGFLSPKVDPELELLDGPTSPTKDSEEFRPFVRRLPEFLFWYAITKAFYVAFLLTFFSMFDVPVFWPILFFYWFFLFFLTMKRQITHMMKYGYLPFRWGKQVIALAILVMNVVTVGKAFLKAQVVLQMTEFLCRIYTNGGTLGNTKSRKSWLVCC